MIRSSGCRISGDNVLSRVAALTAGIVDEHLRFCAPRYAVLLALTPRLD
jgi:hypothetical protein